MSSDIIPHVIGPKKDMKGSRFNVSYVLDCHFLNFAYV